MRSGQERYREEEVRPPNGEGAELLFLRGVVEEGAGRGWRLMSAVKQPGDEALLLTWDTWGAASA